MSSTADGAKLRRMAAGVRVGSPKRETIEAAVNAAAARPAKDWRT
jgi:hypothetical protein